MKSPDDEQELRERFARLRTDDQASVRSFEAMVASAALRAPKRKARRGPSPRLATAMLIVLATAVVIIVVQMHLAAKRQDLWSVRLDPDSVSWEGPTDFLLDTPGRGLLRTIPVLEWQPPRPPVRHQFPRDKGARS
jgi:hypothetical protein